MCGFSEPQQRISFLDKSFDILKQKSWNQKGLRS